MALSNVHKQDLLAPWGATTAADAGRAALSFEGRTLSYAQLHAAIDRAAAVAWHDWGVRPGDRVAWLGANHPGQVVLLFALARIGAMLLPLNFRLAPAEWQAQLGACTPRALVHDASWADAAQALASRCAMAAHHVDVLEQGEARPVDGQGAPEAPVLLVYTSGTTGGPKAAVHTQANLAANMRIAARAQAMTPADTVLTVLPLFHVGGLCIQTLPALGAGARVLLHPRFDPGATLEAVARERPSLTLQVPATMQALIAHEGWPSTDLSCLRAVWAGSSVLPDACIAAFHARGVPVCNVYGATETGPFSIALPPERAFTHVGSCGWPVPEVEARAGAAHGDAVELELRGPNVVARYWPDLPATDGGGWFATGDLARRAADGSWAIVGRAKDLIISGGENIHPAEVEHALASHPAVLECAAFGLPDVRWGEVVAAAVVLRPHAGASDDELRAHLESRIARFKLPRQWYRLEALPKTALGKLQRHLLAAAAAKQATPPR